MEENNLDSIKFLFTQGNRYVEDIAQCEAIIRQLKGSRSIESNEENFEICFCGTKVVKIPKTLAKEFKIVLINFLEESIKKCENILKSINDKMK